MNAIEIQSEKDSRMNDNTEIAVSTSEAPSTAGAEENKEEADDRLYDEASSSCAANGEESPRDAYLRGRNEAITEAMRANADSQVGIAENRTPGIDDPASPPSDEVLAEFFSFRPSVWK